MDFQLSNLDFRLRKGTRKCNARTVRAFALTLGVGLLLSPPLRAQQSPPASPGTSGTSSTSPYSNSGTSTTTTPPTGTSSGTSTGTAAKTQSPTPSAAIMQIKKEVTGDFSYRFITATDTSAAPMPLPATAGTDAIVPLPLPSGLKAKDTQLEVMDNGRGTLARLPVVTSGVTSLNESAFAFAQTVLVPVQAKATNLGVQGASVSLATASKKYNQSWLLKANDNGIAQFSNVPLGEPVTVTIRYASNPPVSVTQTLNRASTPEGYRQSPILLDWPDVKTVPAPVPAPVAGGAKIDAAPAPPLRAPDSNRDDRSGDRSGSGNGFVSLLNSLLGLAVVAGIGYGIYWAYNAGKFKTFFDKAGINVAANGSGTATAPNPFTKPERTPITPITEGTADPFAGGMGAGNAGAFGAAMPVSSGPRLVATAGAYSGNIFPIAGASADIGRDPGNPVALPDDTNTSRRHATLAGSNGQFTITDNGSSNGTFVNGVRIASQTPTVLRSGDEVQIGTTRFRFEA